jgi:Leucine-rich repeat (LRR) protein
MIEEALRRINTTKEEKLHYLDLRGLDLEVIPPEILTIPWIGALSLSDNNISDISLLSQMKELHKLALTNNRINDISTLGSMHKLRFIFLGDNCVEDISVLKSQTRLKKLVLNNNQISLLPDLSPFALLAYLDVSGNPIKLPAQEEIKKMCPLLKIFKS